MLLLNKFIVNYKSNDKLHPLKDHPSYWMSDYYMICKKYEIHLHNLGADDTDDVYFSSIKIFKPNTIDSTYAKKLKRIPKKGIETCFNPYKSDYKSKFKSFKVDTNSYAKARIYTLYTGEIITHTFDF